MTEKIAVSVIVPCYNQEDTIRRCVESILSQDIKEPIEILIGDDASSDRTPEILRELADRHHRIKLFLRTENLGATRNCEALFMSARGKYIAYLEGDDFWTDSRKLSIQTEFLESHPEYVACYHRIHLTDAAGVPIKGRLYWIRYKKVFKYQDFDGLRIPGHSSSWLRRNVFLEPDTDYSVLSRIHSGIGDRTAALFFLSKGDFAFIDRDMGAYRYQRSGGSISSEVFSSAEQSLRSELCFAQTYEKYAANELHRPINIEKRKHRLFFRALTLYLRRRSDPTRSLLDESRRMCRSKAAAVLSIPESILFYLRKKLFYKE